MPVETRRVLVPLEGHACDAAVAATAAALAAQLHAELVLMRLVRPPLPPLFVGGDANMDQIDVDVATIARMTRAVRAANAELTELASLCSGIETSRVILISPRPGARVAEWLRAHTVALVVVARRRTAAAGLTRRREIADEIARSGLAPVLTVDCPQCGERRPVHGGRRRDGRRPRCGRARVQSRFR